MLDADKHMLDYVDDYLHDVLAPADAEVLERHCERCSICEAALQQARQRLEGCRAIPPTEAAERLVQQTVARIADACERREKSWKYLTRTVMCATAASILVIGGLHLAFYRMKPTPYELRILGQDRLLGGSPACVRVGVFDHGSGRPVVGVPVEMSLINPQTRETVQLVSFQTGASGTASPRIQLPPWSEGKYELRIAARPPGASEEVIQRDVTLQRSWKLMVSSDKPLYQPGQTIHIRALALRRPNLHPVAGEVVVFSVTDPKGNVIFKHRDVTSKFGIAAVDCPLADEIREGAYELQCALADTTSRRQVEVQKYTLPKFKVELEADRPFYAPGEQVQGTVQSDYFFGQPVAGAEVKLVAYVTEAEVRELHSQVGRSDTVDLFQFLDLLPVRELHSQVGRSDDNGRFAFAFRLPDQLVGREQETGNARVQLVATVTDVAGQNHVAGLSRLVTSQPIQLEVIPEGGTLVQGLENKIYLMASYADGRPARVRVAVNGQTEELQTNRLGVAAFQLVPREEQVGLTLKATDDDGMVGRRNVQLQCGVISGDYLIRTDKAVYDGGDTLTLDVLGGGVEPVFVDLIKDGQTILSQTVELADGGGQLQIDLPAELFGTIELVAYRFGSAGVPVRKSRLVFVRQSNQLQIKAVLDAEQYRPGEKARLEFTLTDGQGRPAPGALSLAAVDEAVYSVLSRPAGLERTFFLLDQELLEPVYAIYDWSPFEESAVPVAERVLWEQALFAQTARSDVQTAGHGEGKGPFTLIGNSYPQKRELVRRTRAVRLYRAQMAWLCLAGALVMVCIGSFAAYRPRAFLISLAVCGGALAAAIPVLALLASFLLLVGSEAAREFAMGAKAGVDAQVADMMAPTDPANGVASDGSAAPPRVREWFPETLLWRPELVTDDEGRAVLELDLADSITTWRVSAFAVTGGGQLGSGEFPIRVFQPFFVDLDLPVLLTRNDKVSIPVVVYNYLDASQTVELELKPAGWFERHMAEDQQNTPWKLELAAGEVRSLHIPIKVLEAGNQQLEVTARSGSVADAIRRSVEVVPDGRPVEQVASGTLVRPAEITLDVPPDAIPGSVQAIIKLHPSGFSQLVEGLDAIFRMPHGCFEQTSSTTYPNILALDYLRRTGMNVPEVEAKARQYVHVGYQRLLSFEVAGGGFDWFGNPPANETLTAYGLMEFQDMSRVHDVDPAVIRRTRDWLLSRRRADGSWSEQRMINDGLAGSVQRGTDPHLATSAYIAWAVFGNGEASNEAGVTVDYLLSQRPETIDDPYTLALVTNALAGIDANRAELRDYATRLEQLKMSDEQQNVVWWEQLEGQRTTFFGAGRSGDVETTAMATLALLKTGGSPRTVRGALGWLAAQKDGRGTWHSTQATVLALKALLAGTGKPLTEGVERQFEVELDGDRARTITIPEDQFDVMIQIEDLASLLSAGQSHRMIIRETTESASNYQVTFRYHVPEPEVVTDPQPLGVQLTYDRRRLDVDETVTAVATVKNNMTERAPMVILDLPIPGGFRLEAGELDELLGSGTIARYQITPRKAIVYLRSLAPGDTIRLRYRLRATMPLKVAVPPAEAYEYYDPDKRGSSGSAQLEAGLM